MNIYPYVYRLDHPVTGEFYVGYRSANKVPAEQDLGYKYFTSSKYVKPRFHEFECQIIAIFFDKISAIIFEQNEIASSWKDSLCLNKNVVNSSGTVKFICDSHSDETRRKISLSHKGKKKSAQTIELMSKLMMGHVVTDETKQKIREKALLRDKPSAETRRKLSEAGKRKVGFKHTEEAKTKIGLSSSGRIHKEETKKKISNSLKGRPSPMKGKTPWNKGLSTNQKGIPKTKTICRIFDRKEMAMSNFMKWFNNQILIALPHTET